MTEPLAEQPVQRGELGSIKRGQAELQKTVAELSADVKAVNRSVSILSETVNQIVQDHGHLSREQARQGAARGVTVGQVVTFAAIAIPTIALIFTYTNGLFSQIADHATDGHPHTVRAEVDVEKSKTADDREIMRRVLNQLEGFADRERADEYANGQRDAKTDVLLRGFVALMPLFGQSGRQAAAADAEIRAIQKQIDAINARCTAEHAGRNGHVGEN